MQHNTAIRGKKQRGPKGQEDRCLVCLKSFIGEGLFEKKKKLN